MIFQPLKKPLGTLEFHIIQKYYFFIYTNNILYIFIFLYKYNVNSSSIWYIEIVNSILYIVHPDYSYFDRWDPTNILIFIKFEFFTVPLVLEVEYLIYNIFFRIML